MKNQKPYIIFVLCFAYVVFYSNMCLAQCSYDFEKTRQGWVVETHKDVRGAKSATISDLISFSKQYSLKVTLELSKQSESTSNGEVRVDFRTHPPFEKAGILDLENCSITTYVNFPEEFEGAASSPNGVQLFAKSYEKDSNGNEIWGNLYGRWVNATGMSDEWVDIHLFISKDQDDDIYIKNFNPKKVCMIGVKFGLGGNAPNDISFIGDVFVDCVIFNQKK